MGENITMLYFEAESCFLFIQNDFIFIKLLLQKDIQILSISDRIFKKTENILD